MDREEISGISKEFDKVLSQVAPTREPIGFAPPAREPAGTGPSSGEASGSAPGSRQVKAWKREPSASEKEQEEYLDEELPESPEWELQQSEIPRTIRPRKEVSDLKIPGGPVPGEPVPGGTVSGGPAPEGQEMSGRGQKSKSKSKSGLRAHRKAKRRKGLAANRDYQEYEDEGEENWDGEEQEQWDSEPSSLGFLRPNDGLIAAFFIPIIIMVVIFAQRGIFPFGSDSFLRTDMYHQYAPFFSEFQDKLRHGGSLLYSWDIGLGVNFAALYAYYLASPLNWLLILCPKEYIIEFMTYSIVFKIGLSGLTFAYYLKKHNHCSRFGVGFFGIFYALSGYMAAYSWNIMWLDCILLFPLIMLGLERLVKEKKGMLYCITLGLSILSNYYISIMICIFMVIYFIALQVLEGRRGARDYLVTVFQFGFYSLLAGALAGVVLLPEISALQSTASGDWSFPKDYEAYFSIIDMLARHIGNVETEIGLKHWPNIYCGVAVYMFFLLYVMCGKIPAKEKAVYCTMAILFFASFSINVLNFIWHGFHYPNSLPARQSFIYIFLILSMCYRAYMYLDGTSKKRIAAAFGGSVFFVLMLQKEMFDDKAYHFIVFYVAILFLALYTGVIYFYKNPARSKAAAAMIALGVVAVEAAVNTTVTSVSTTSRSAYKEDNQEVAELTGDLTSDQVFYRIDKVNAKTKNDGAWMNFPSVSLFSSLANADVTDFFKRVGCEGSTNAYSINGSTPLVDSLFSVQYALYKGKQENPRLALKEFSGETYLYENPYTLPLGFVVPEGMEENWQFDMPNPVDVQNSLVESLGAPSVLAEVYSENNGRSFTFTPQEDGEYYVYLLNRRVKTVNVTIEDESRTFENLNRGFFVELGYLKTGVPVTVENREDSEELNARAYLFEEDSLKEIHEKLNAQPFTVTRWDDDKLEGVVDGGEGGTVFLSIPYDKGWSIQVDGRTAIGRKAFGAFTAFGVGAGQHTVTLQYRPDGLKKGAILSAAALAMLLASWGIGILLSKKKKGPTPYDRLDEEWHGREEWHDRPEELRRKRNEERNDR